MLKRRIIKIRFHTEMVKPFLLCSVYGFTSFVHCLLYHSLNKIVTKVIGFE